MNTKLLMMKAIDTALPLIARVGFYNVTDDEIKEIVEDIIKTYQSSENERQWLLASMRFFFTGEDKFFIQMEWRYKLIRIDMEKRHIASLDPKAALANEEDSNEDH